MLDEKDPLPGVSAAAARQRLSRELHLLVLRAEHEVGKSLSRPELARRINVSPASLYAYLNGTTLPRGDVFDRLLTALGASDNEVGPLATLRDRAEVAQRSRPAGGVQEASPRSVVATMAASQASVRPYQLPAVTFDVVGRNAELAELDQVAAVRAPAGRPVLITAIAGTAGVGKTTLAVHWAHRVRDQFPDGLLYVNLRGYDERMPVDPEQALHDFLQALGVGAVAIPAGLDAKAALFRTLLAERRMLVVVDNVHTADQARPLLPGSPTCLALVTSRDRLESLVVREGAHRVELDVLSRADAVTLLDRRLGAGRLVGTDDAAFELVELCSRLPLALGVAAARLQARPVETLRGLVDDLRDVHRRLDVLGSSEADVDLRTVFQWSYAALPDPAARLFRLLGVHPGPDLDDYACAALLGVHRRPVDALRALAAAHLTTEPSPGRRGLHDLLRGFAVERSWDDEAPVRLAAATRMLDYYLSTALLANRLIQIGRAGELPTVECAWPTPPMASYADAMSWFSDELPALRMLIPLAADLGLRTHAWRLAWACTVFLRRTGRRSARVAVHRVALDAALAAGDRTAYAATLRLLADALARDGGQDEAIGLLHTSLAEFRALGDRDGIRQAYLSLARVHEARHQYAAALEDATHALRLARGRGGGDLLARADGLTAVSRQRCWLGDHDDALSLGLRALALYIRIGHLEGQKDVLMTIGLAEHRLGQLHQARLHHERSLDLDRELGDDYWAAKNLERLADIHQDLGDEAQAERLRAEALALLERLGHPDARALRPLVGNRGGDGPDDAGILPKEGG